MIYNAMDVANYIINRCYVKKKPVSNLQLQKVLYFVWVDFYKKSGRTLFIDSICAWQLGPVVPEVYYVYCLYGGRPINISCETCIEPSDEMVLNPIIDEYINIPVSTLVARTHQKGTAWDCVYQNGAGKRRQIPSDLIKRLECEGSH